MASRIRIGLGGIKAGFALLLIAALGCAGADLGDAAHETGMLPARWTGPNGHSQEVPFSFEASNAKMGKMYTTLGKGGEHFQGIYVRVEASTKGHLVTEVYNGWSSPEWEIWQKDADGHWTATAKSFGEFAHFYTGKIVASLRGNQGHQMRCRFTLTNPQADLLRDGTGECQITNGERIDLNF